LDTYVDARGHIMGRSANGSTSDYGMINPVEPFAIGGGGRLKFHTVNVGDKDPHMVGSSSIDSSIQPHQGMMGE
jgi:hypothetical protein